MKQSVYVAYATSAFSAAALHNVFLIYYVDVFLNVYHLQTGWFYFGETIYMIWNSVNDPLFGWLLSRRSGGSRRIDAIRYGGLFWCMALLSLFFPWTSNFREELADGNSGAAVGLHFTFSICFYDGMLSLVQLAHSSLLADLSITAEDRARCNMYSSILSSVGANSVFISHFFWNRQDLTAFRWFCLALTVVAFGGFQYTAANIHERKTVFDIARSLEQEETAKKKQPSLRVFAKQLLRHTNFWIFVAFTLIQVFNCHFNSNFLSIFMEYFVGKDRTLLHSVILSLASILPHVFVVVLANRIPSFGLYNVYQTFVIIKIVLSLLAYLFTENAGWAVFALFLLANKVFSETICRHGNLVLADLVDEDFVLNNRAQSMSSMIFGANALFSKPGQSLAPMLGWYLLSRHHQYDPTESEVHKSLTVPSDVMFRMLVLVPLFCGILQFFLWRMFALKGDKLKEIKAQRIRAEDENLSPL
eukprot:TRINITY_DN11119_c0_g1_i1.p1 TRINITY_DN11119_c0_g1~~TRINITY_DN11119_c0_g1_i1.p1  ORF type:complete len:474 (-),score=86.24 TRINITY_DN11119_c0_g1_i1:66-1487(-)